jgi:hypothetical protein
LSEEVIPNLTKLKSMMNTCNRIKNVHLKDFNPNFDDIPNFLHFDMTGKKFLQYNHGVKNERRFVILFSEDNHFLSTEC